LQKLGFEPIVYERAESLNEIGAGIWLQPNALKVMEWLGIKNLMEEAGSKIDRMEITYPNLKPIRTIKKEMVRDEFGNEIISIHRGKLQALLVAAFRKEGKLELGTEYLSHKSDKDSIEITFPHKTIRTDILLGADGIRSKVRTQLMPYASLRDTKQICWRGIANFALAGKFKRKGREMWGPGIRFGFSEISPKQVYWYAVANSTLTPKNIEKDELKALLKKFDPMVLQLIQNTKSWNTDTLMDLKRLRSWHTDRVCLIGDAAHATTPNMGQGACQGIEDAYYISNFLSQYERTNEAFSRFESERRKKVDYVVKNSWALGKMAHHSIGQSVLKLVMKVTPENIINRQMNTLNSIKHFS